METTTYGTGAQQHGRHAPEDCRLEDLVAVAQQQTDPADDPSAERCTGGRA